MSRCPSQVGYLGPWAGGSGPIWKAAIGDRRAQKGSQAGVDIIVEKVRELLTGGKPSLRAIWWPRLLEHLSGGLDGQPNLTPASTGDQAQQSLLSTATARALGGALLRYREASNDVWQDLWSQQCEGGCVPSRSILPQLLFLQASVCGKGGRDMTAIATWQFVSA